MKSLVVAVALSAATIAHAEDLQPLTWEPIVVGKDTRSVFMFMPETAYIKEGVIGTGWMIIRAPGKGGPIFAAVGITTQDCYKGHGTMSIIMRSKTSEPHEEDRQFNLNTKGAVYHAVARRICLLARQ